MPSFEIDVQTAEPRSPRNGRRAPYASPALRYEVFTDFAAARRVRARWDALVAQLDGDVFATFDWCEVWWRHFGDGRRLEIHTAALDDDLVAVLPLFRETLRWGPFALRCVKLVGCDHSNTTCAPTIDPRHVRWVIEQMVETLARGPEWDILHFGELPGHYRDARLQHQALQGALADRAVSWNPDFHPQMVFDLPGDYESYLAALPRKERRNLRHDEREIQKECQAPSAGPSSPSEVTSCFGSLVQLHEALWRRRGWLGHFGDFPGVEAFHRDAAEQMRAQTRLLFIEVGDRGRSVAAEYCLRFGRRVHWIIGGRLPETSSRIGVGAIVRESIALNAGQIDALNGYYDYKRRLGARVVSLQTLTAEATSVGSRFRLSAMRAITWLAFQVYFRAWYWHFAPWVRRHFPSMRWWPLETSIPRRFLRSRFLVRCGRVDQNALADCGEDVHEQTS